MSENLNKKLDELLESATKMVKEGSEKAIEIFNEGSEKAMEIFNDEKTKAKIRSNIGLTKRELSKDYEELGRKVFQAIEEKQESPDFTDLINTIRSKERVITLLNEKINDTISEDKD